MENNQSLIPASVGINGEDVTTWALPEGAIARLGRGREPDIKFSPDGKYIAIGTSLGLWLYDLLTLSPVALWETERGMVFNIAFSPNSKWIAVSNSDQILKVLDIQNGRCLTRVETEEYIIGLTFSPDNRYLTAGYVHSPIVEVWDIETGETHRKFTADAKKAGYYNPICFSPDTHMLASTCKTDMTQDVEAIVVLCMESGEQIACLSGHTNWVTTLCFSPCGQFLTSGGEDGNVYIWDVNTWQQVQLYTDFGDVYRIILSYSPDGVLRAAIVTYDQTGPATISVCELESGKQLYTDQFWGNSVNFSYIGNWGNTVVFSNGSRLAYECRHEFIKVWTLDNPLKRQFTHSPISFPTSMAFSGDGKSLAVNHHHEGVILWDVKSKRSRPAVKMESVGKNQFVYKTESGKLYAASIKDDIVTLWEADGDGTPLIEGTGRKYWSAFPTLAPAGTLFAYAGVDGNIQVWNVQNGKKLHELTHPLETDDDDEDEDDGDSIEKLEFNYDGKLLASESKSHYVRLWDMELGEEIEMFPSNSVTGIIEFSPCGQYLACKGEEILFWDIVRRELRLSGLNQGPFGFIKFSPDGQYLACSGEETFMFDLKRGEIHVQLSLPQEYEGLHSTAFSTCGKYIAGGAWWEEGLNKVPVCLWEITTGKLLASILGHPTDIQALAFSPDNKLLASASYDGSILLWDLTPIIDS